jgi:hypothetical protein
MFKKKKDKFRNDMSILEISARLREFILDSQIQNAHELSVILGCPHISEDVMEREEEESDKRVDKISHLVPLLYAQAHALAEGSIEYQRSNLPESLKGVPDELWWESRKMMEQISLAVLVGSISQLVELGLVELPKKKKGLFK